MAENDWQELEGYGHRIRYRWLDERREKYVNETRGWERVKPLNFLDGFRLGWKAASRAMLEAAGRGESLVTRDGKALEYPQTYVVPPDPSDPRERP